VGSRADGGGGVDQAALGRHVGDGDQPHALVEHPGERLDRELPVLVVGDHLDAGPGPARHLPGRDHVAGVLGARDQDAVAWGEAHRVEGHVPGPGRVLDHGQLPRLAADQRCQRLVGALDLGVLSLLGLVAADGGLQLEVAEDRVQHRSWGQPRTRVVEVQDTPTAGGLGAGALQIDGHAVPPRGKPCRGMAAATILRRARASRWATAASDLDRESVWGERK